MKYYISKRMPYTPLVLERVLYLNPLMVFLGKLPTLNWYFAAAR